MVSAISPADNLTEGQTSRQQQTEQVGDPFPPPHVPYGTGRADLMKNQLIPEV